MDAQSRDSGPGIPAFNTAMEWYPAIYEKQVNDTNFYSHYISPLTILKLPVVPRNITIHDCCTFAKRIKTASAVNDLFVKKIYNWV